MKYTNSEGAWAKADAKSFGLQKDEYSEYFENRYLGASSRYGCGERKELTYTTDNKTVSFMRVFNDSHEAENFMDQISGPLYDIGVYRLVPVSIARIKSQKCEEEKHWKILSEGQ